MFSELDLIMSYKFADRHPTMVDVGAHHGFLALPFAREGWEIIAFEPENSNYKAFRINLKNFRNVKIFKEAVSDVSGIKVPFYVSDKYYGIHSLKRFDNTHKCKYWVKTVRLDDKLRRLRTRNVTFLKIDIEGADFWALRSFDFDHFSPEIIMVEFMDARTIPHFGYSYVEMAEFMLAKGYDCYVSEWSEIKEYGRLGVETEPTNWLRCVPYNKVKHKPLWGNLIFIPKQDAEKFEDTLNKYLDFLKNGGNLKNGFIFYTLNLKGTINRVYGRLFGIVSAFKNCFKDFQVNIGNNGKIGVIDVGAAGGLPDYWEKNPKLIKKILRFEPRGSLCLNKNIITEHVALWKSKSVKKFYIYKGYGGTGSSLFKQNYNFVKKNYERLKFMGAKSLAETWFERSSLLRIEKIDCEKLDAVLVKNKLLGMFDFLKIDAQGAEFEILSGAEEYLKKDCLAVFLEAFSVPLYTNIKLLPDIRRLLKKYNFTLAKKFPAHGSFASQNDCLFIKKGGNKKKINIIKTIYNI